MSPSGKRRKSSAERRSSAEKAERRKARKSVMVPGTSKHNEFLSTAQAILDYPTGSTRKVYPEQVNNPGNISLSRI